MKLDGTELQVCGGPHLSTHSVTTAKFPSPITFPTRYFSLMMEEETERFPFTAEKRTGSDYINIYSVF